MLEDLETAELYATASDLYLTLLDTPPPAGSRDAEARLGLSLASMASESDDTDVERDLLQRMGKVFPTNADVKQRLKDL